MFAYCAWCGEKLDERTIDEVARLVCRGCSRVSYVNSKPVVSAVVARGDELLLVKRGIEPKKGMWALPAGFLEYGEHPEEGIKREVREETGVDVAVEKLLHVSAYDYRAEYETKLLDLTYLARPVSGEPGPTRESLDVQWFSYARLPELSAPAHRTAVEVWRDGRARIK